MRTGGVVCRTPALPTALLTALPMCDRFHGRCHDDEAAVRPFRFGQTKPVYIYRLVSAGTYEERVIKRQAHKNNLALRVGRPSCLAGCK